MTTELLDHLADAYAFDSTPSFTDLGIYHVPFDGLVAGAAVEHRLGAAVGRGERVAIVASSGSGKSSVVAHTLAPTVGGVAPILVPVRAVEAATGATPASVADEILTMLRRYAEEAMSLSDGDRRRAEEAAAGFRRTTRGERRSGALAFALGWLGPTLGREITRQTELDLRVSLAEKTEVVEQLLRAVAADGLRPVLVFDDSDRWIGSPEVEAVRRFFGDVVRWAADLPAAVVATVHDRYFEHLPRRALLQHLDTPVELPRLTAPAQLGSILHQRVQANVVDTGFDGARLSDAFDDGAVEALFEIYAGGGTLRHVIQICHIALIEAVERLTTPVVTADDVVAAVNAG